MNYFFERFFLRFRSKRKKKKIAEIKKEILAEPLKEINDIEVISEEIIPSPEPNPNIPKKNKFEIEKGTKLITTKEIIDIYSEPDETGEYLETIELPFPMKLSWDLDRIVKKMRCHRLLKEQFLGALNEILDVYGIDRIEELGINIFGGCFNFRKMRNGTDWSRHSWGIAIDLDPQRNTLRTKWKNANFSKPKYKEMIDIFYKWGFQSLGLEKGYDGMHFQIGIIRD